MTEVPEHLLARSKERRAALGGGDAGGATPPAGAASGPGVDPQEAPGRAVATTAAAAPAVVEPAAPPPPPPPYVQAALDRKKVPSWMAGAGVLTLLWAFVYAGVLFAPETSITDPILAQGQEIYARQCAGCHGGSGGGGTGRPLANEVVLTFPDRADHIAWVVNGSPAAGTPYGDPNRPGGQHISQDGWGAMPGFGDALTEEEILAVVRYEREVLDHEEANPATEEAGGAGGSTGDEGEQDGADDPTNEAQSEGGSTNESGSSDEGTDTGSGETQGAEEDSTDLDGGDDSTGDGGPENP